MLTVPHINHQNCAVVTKKKQKDIGEDLRSVLWILMVKMFWSTFCPIDGKDCPLVNRVFNCAKALLYPRVRV